ncbi:hypothetical protein DL93DRAFT_2056211 [Clavulina sp. PMI_390]|nr:hypothetical protein DL93DRAFT_2056211 [Clavulina sp. PMI_390]
MTSRLKRKLDNIGIDPSSSKATESFCLIGTPLPPLEKARDQNEFVPLWKQDVRDEQGRRRLHGAFTGGFSAGYFNTVGSKEGWTPSTFKSSRDSRAASKAARPEDFMDDEDLEELRNSKKIVDQTEEMDLLGGTQGELSRRGGATTDDDPLASAVANALLPPSSDSAGAQLLRKMGWRAGQGVGPRVTYDQLRRQDLQSSDLPMSSKTEEMEVDEEAKKHTFAPRDTKTILFRAKDNQFGLGYVPGTTLADAVSKAQSSGPNISAGFGLGALNDAEDDDVDVYDIGGPRQSSRTIAYDDDEPRHKVTLGSQQASQNRRPLQERQPSVPTGIFNDGRPVLTGFALSDKPVAEDTWFKLPDIPKGWKPDPNRVWSASDAAATSKAPNPETGRPDASRFKSTGKTLAEERGEKLGETGLPDQKPRSVFDYLSDKDRARLQNMTSKPSDEPSSSSASATSAPAPSISVPKVDSPVAQAALRGFQPFLSYPEKHARYTLYLKSQTVPSGGGERSAPPGRKPSQSIEEYNHELEEFAKSALIFKPMSGAMANRFTTAAIVETGPKVQEGLHMPAPSDASKSYLSSDDARAGDAAKKIEVEETPKQHAARMGMYGPMTREVSVWAPARLLCKRFGVKDPQPTPADASTSEAASSAAPTASGKPSWEENGSTPVAGDVSMDVDAPAPSRSGPKDISNIGLGEDDDQGRDTLTYKRPGMDIFKAIFASDDEDSDDDESPQEEAQAPPAIMDGSAPSIKSPPPSLPDDGPVDLASFKPKFISKANRDKTKADADPSSSTSKKSKRKSEGKPKKSLVSFNMDDDEASGGLSIVPDSSKKDKDKKRKDKDRDGEKKRRRDSEADVSQDVKRPRAAAPAPAASSTAPMDADDDDEWVEKSPPRIPEASDATAHSGVDPRKPGRMRASDFM